MMLQCNEFKTWLKELTLNELRTKHSKIWSNSYDLIINNKKYHIVTATHGGFVEIDGELVTKNQSEFKNPFFKMSGINFDNYKK